MSNHNEKYEKLAQVIREHREQKGALMPVLQAAQNIFGCVPLDVQEIIADGLGVTLSEVYGVATFYSQFSLQPKGEYVCGVCLGTACCHERSSLLGSHILHNLFEYICRNCHFLNNFSLIGNDSTISCNKINIIFYRCKHSFNTVIFSAADSRKYNSLSLQLSDNIINFRINIHGAFFQKCTIQI